MNNLPGDSQSRQHCLSDWLAVHELDSVTCRRILDALPWDAGGTSATDERLDFAYQEPNLEAVWFTIAAAMGNFLSDQRGIVDDIFEKTVKICVDHPDKSRKALTLDNGSTAYPTIIFSYRSDRSDPLVMAHEFGHALQIRASRGKFVPPIIREVCAFLGEGALLSHTLRGNASQHAHLSQVWREDTIRYFGPQRDRLRGALLEPNAPYKYFWNYPIARFLAIQISKQCSQEWVWSIFEGKSSVRAVLRELDFSVSQ
ncbi:hypothetical protein [Sphingomonas sp. M1-B02]|uniref:hypothetical protein n=1 Tax=Sphingomonas sp. M1-B02 TaxID=3114300 RepID=UPI00223F71F5|nr:hypothetical protein [Sphingomonas sp. S6-11]UZK67709.1 hypothetical protein OKW87_07740 [Sphingomonas sp. S6-11]